jgi:hypothetical protein
MTESLRLLKWGMLTMDRLKKVRRVLVSKSKMLKGARVMVELSSAEATEVVEAIDTADDNQIALTAMTMSVRRLAAVVGVTPCPSLLQNGELLSAIDDAIEWIESAKRVL